MAETLISPGVLARENDQSQVTSQPVQAGACLVGPTVLGRVGIPKLVTSYSEYLSAFGSTFASGSNEYSYFTSISAYNYFNNGGTSLIVNRVASGSFSQATTTAKGLFPGDPIRNDIESGDLTPAPWSFTASMGSTGQLGTAFSGTAAAAAPYTSTIFDVVTSTALGSFTSDALAKPLKSSIAANITPVATGTYNAVPITVGTNATATANFEIVADDYTNGGSTVAIASAGSGYADGETATIAAGALGTGFIKTTPITSATYIVASSPNLGNQAAAVIASPVPNTPTVGAGGAGATFSVETTKAVGRLFSFGNAIAPNLFTYGDTGVAVGAYVQGVSAAIPITGDAATGGVASIAGNGGTISLTVDPNGAITSCQVSGVGSSGFVENEVITFTQAVLTDPAIGNLTAAVGGPVTLTLAAAGGADNIDTTVANVTATAQGVNYQVGDSFEFAGTDLGYSSGTVTLTLGQASFLEDSPATTFTIFGDTAAGTTQISSNLLIQPTSVKLNTQGTSDFKGIASVTIPLANFGTPSTDGVITFTNADLVDEESFTLETLTDGIVMNSYTSPESANGTLDSGSADNIRWEIQASDTTTGTFSLIIRQGNDTATSKRILEIFPNISLDPKQSNYIERVVGTQKKTLNGAGTSDPFISTEGSYRNGSRYVRVSAVDWPTPNYFDNNGAAKAAFANYLPDVGSGSFGGGEGALITSNAGYEQELYYDKITDANSQGIKDGVGNGIESYTDAFNVLANKDDYQYNIISAPGLYISSGNWATPLNVMIDNTANRGDAIAIVDLVSYAGGSVTTAVTQAGTLDNSYAAAYWPWVQIIDPDTRDLVWTVPSSMIPGVYAYNDRTSEAWFAPAGINRGGLSTVVQAQRKLTQTNRDTLYTGKVNPIATFPGRGVVVFGQKTLQSQASALDRINVRRLLIALKSYIVQIADNLVFEQNTAATRNNFLSQVNPYLESVQQRQGLYAFKVVMDASNNGPDVVDRNQMVGAIYIQPTKTAEFIYLDFNILPTGAEFPS